MKRLLACVLLLPAVAAALPAVNRASLRFFEQADGDILADARRVYATRFDATRTRRLGIEYSAEYAAPGADATVPLDCRLTRPDGSTAAAERPMDFRFYAGKAGSATANLAWGTADEQEWPAGVYRVECAGEGMPAVAATFEVVRNPPEVADGDIRVRALRLFAVEELLPPIADRRYASRFAAEATRRIGVELEFSHAPLGRAARIPIDCWFFWPDGQTSSPLALSYEPQPAWAGGYSAGATGYAEPGVWKKGVYTVSCAISGQPVAVDRFDVD